MDVLVAYVLPFAAFLGLYALLRRRASEPQDVALPAGVDTGGWSATHVRFFAAWVLGVVAMLLLDVDDGFGALMLPSGLLLCWAGVALARDPREWDRFRAVASRHARAGALPGTAWVRWSFAVVLMIIGAGWTLGGIVALV